MLDYLAARLADATSMGRVRAVSDPDAWFALIDAKYPTGHNRIAWDRLLDRTEIAIAGLPSEIESGELEARLSECRETLRSWFRQHRVDSGTETVWVGDNTDVGFAMTLDTLLEFFPVLFSLPQHSYALPPDAAWCLNYVMEGHLYIGSPP